MSKYQDDDWSVPPLPKGLRHLAPEGSAELAPVPTDDRSPAMVEATDSPDRVDFKYKTGNEFQLYDYVAEHFDPKPCRIYQKGGTLVQVARDEVLRVMTATPISKPSLYLAINRQVCVRRMETRGKEVGWLPSKIPNEVVDGYMDSTHRPTVPELRAVVSSPIINESGDILTAEGDGERERYDPETRLLASYRDDWPVDLMEPDEAVEVLRKLFIDTAFGDPADFGAGLCLLLSMVSRHLLTDCPSFLMTAAAEGTGKSTFVEICGAIAYGIRKLPGRTFSSESEEMNKSLLSIGRSGLPVCFFDNIPTGSRIGSPPLEMALTSGVVSSRILGESKDANARFDCLVVFTANNPSASPDMARRMIVCRFDNKGVAPSEKRWKELDILSYTLRHRRKLWNCVASILCNHLRTLHREQVRRKAQRLDETELRRLENRDRADRRYWKADFPCWSRIVLGAVEPWVRDNPLQSTQDFQIECNPDLADAGAVFLAMKGQGRMTAGEIVSRGKDYRPLGEALAAWGKAGMPPDARAVGRKLSGLVDRHLAGLRLEAKTEHNQRRFWVTEND
jgi:hypothetical protein